MKPIEQVRGALTKALGFTDSYQTHGLDERYRAESSDVYDKLRAALATLKDMEAQEPVADEEQELADHYLYMGWLGARPERPWTDEDAREAFLHALKYARAHPSPSAPVDIAEVIRAGDVMHEAMVRYQMDVDDDPPMKHRDMMEAWTTATAKHRTALEGPKNQGNTSNADEYR